jgi:hypothetical protein
MTASTLSEARNVAYQALTSQMQDELDKAVETKRLYHLYVRGRHPRD